MNHIEAMKRVAQFVKEGHVGKSLSAINAAIEAAEKQEPVAWRWMPAPVKTQWGHEMVVADLAIDKDHTVSIYCERDQAAKVEAMFTAPPTAPVQEPAPLECTYGYSQCRALAIAESAQRQWAGLTPQEVHAIWSAVNPDWHTPRGAVSAIYEHIEAKLKEKNT
jgi:hypothetical protein